MAQGSALAMGETTGTGTFLAAPARVKAVIITPAAADATAVIRDGGGGGTIKITLKGAANGASVVFTPPDGVAFSTDIHVTLSGAGATLDIGYQP